LLELIEHGEEGLSVEEYRALVEQLPAVAMASVEEAWGSADIPQLPRSTLPPSVLPDISPSSGEICWPLGFRQLPTL
jgi:cobaltochelatase CobN